jgi:2-polyprenyl-3-methyl-5-hydroxy-6-metoxy-1,4-benzoquinol methylase
MSRENDAKAIFSDIFHEGAWKGSVPSGPGSSLGVTALIRERMAEAFDDLGIRSLCDAPCGDMTWMSTMTDRLDSYTGIDVVEELIEAHNARKQPNQTFLAGDIITMDLPRADAILCRDCLVHLPLEHAQSALRNMVRSGATYLILTTFPKWEKNTQARMGSWRPLNLQLAPFNFPDPVRILAERDFNPNDAYNDNSLGIWAVDSLRHV